MSAPITAETFGAVEMTSPEPPLAATLRHLAAIGKYGTLHVIDGSRIKGKIVDVSSDGTTVTVDNVDTYVFDTAAIVFVKIENSAGEAKG